LRGARPTPSACGLRRRVGRAAGAGGRRGCLSGRVPHGAGAPRGVSAAGPLRGLAAPDRAQPRAQPPPCAGGPLGAAATGCGGRGGAARHGAPGRAVRVARPAAGGDGGPERPAARGVVAARSGGLAAQGGGGAPGSAGEHRARLSVPGAQETSRPSRRRAHGGKLMDEHPIDLSPLDPAADPDRWERLIETIARAAAPELARRAETRSVIAIIGHWLRPALAAGIVLAVGATATLSLLERDAERPPMPTAGLEEALELGEPVSLWLSENRAPTTSDLLLALDGEAP